MESNFKKDISKTAFAYFLLFGVSTLLQVGAVSAIMLIAPKLYENPIVVTAVAALPIYLTAAAIYFFMIRPMGAPAQMGSERIKPAQFLLLALFCIGLTYMFNIVSMIITTLIGFIKGSAVMNPLSEAVSGNGIIFSILYTSIIAPICEELIFRKVLWRAVGKYGERIYVIMSAVIFALFHGNLSQMLYAAALGAVFALVYARTGKIVYTIILHIILNVLGTIIVPQLIANGGDAVSVTVTLFMIATMMFAASLLALYLHKIKLADNGEAPLPERPVRTMFTSVGMIIYIAFAVIVTIFMTVV